LLSHKLVGNLVAETGAAIRGCSRNY